MMLLRNGNYSCSCSVKVLGCGAYIKIHAALSCFFFAYVYRLSYIEIHVVDYHCVALLIKMPKSRLM